eukprot:3935371-Rhodomonas_salina.1
MRRPLDRSGRNPKLQTRNPKHSNINAKAGPGNQVELTQDPRTRLSSVQAARSDRRPAQQ